MNKYCTCNQSIKWKCINDNTAFNTILLTALYLQTAVKRPKLFQTCSFFCFCYVCLFICLFGGCQKLNLWFWNNLRVIASLISVITFMGYQWQQWDFVSWTYFRVFDTCTCTIFMNIVILFLTSVSYKRST